MTTPPVLRAALASWRETRAAYQDYLEAQYQAAQAALGGVMVNPRGQRAGVDSMSLFMGPWSRVEAYATRELREWFLDNGRLTFAAYERQVSATPGHSWGDAWREWRYPGEEEAA